jgi:hypothetical protein
MPEEAAAAVAREGVAIHPHARKPHWDKPHASELKADADFTNQKETIQKSKEPTEPLPNPSPPKRRTICLLSTDPRSRFRDHNSGKSKHTAKYKAWRLVNIHCLLNSGKGRSF